MNKYTIFIGRDKLNFVKNREEKEINFELNEMISGDIVDEKAFCLKVENFLKDNQYKPGNTTIILKNEVLYTKYFPVINKKINPKEIENFKECVPIDPDKAKYKIMIGKDKYGVMGVNSDLYNVLGKYLEAKKWKIEAVFPEIVSHKNHKQWDLRK